MGQDVDLESALLPLIQAEIGGRLEKECHTRTVHSDPGLRAREETLAFPSYPQSSVARVLHTVNLLRAFSWTTQSSVAVIGRAEFKAKVSRLRGL